MYITDVDSFIKLASIGMDGRKNYDTDSYYSKGYELSILYRMKDGRKIYRCIFVPYDTDETLMDSIISSEEYKKGHYICFDDDAIREMTGSNVGNNSVSYVSAGGRKSDDTITYVEISDAYRKDILEGANYSYLKKNQPIGSLEFSSNGTHYVNVSVPVYETSTNLLKLIKDHNIYVEPKLSPEMISSIRVDNYYPGYNLDDFDSGKYLRDEEVMTTSATYDPVKNSKEVSEILQDIVTSDYNGNWYDYSQKDNKYSVVITKKSDGSDYYGSDGSYYSFLKGKVPEFVVKDTE
jgi:ABC-2 type transport system permease protein